MKIFHLILLCSCTVFSADWKANIAELKPELIIDFAHDKKLEQGLMQSLEKNSAAACPFNAPVGSIRFVQDKGVKTPSQSIDFKKGIHQPKRAFAVYRYSAMLPTDMKVLAKIQYGKLFKTYLNGKLLAQHDSGLLYHRESPFQTLSFKKGRNDLVFISMTKDQHIPHLRAVPYSEKLKEAFNKYLSKFDKIKQQDMEEWLNFQLALRSSDLFEAQAHGIRQVVNLNYQQLPQGRIRHFFHMGIHPRVMSKVMGSIDTEKIVDLMIAINHPHIKSYFDTLAIEGRGKEIVQFFELYAKKYKAKSGYSWGNNLYAIAEFILMQGDAKSAHEMFLLFKKVADQKNKSTQKNIEYALLESQDESGIRPRFTADPEVEVFVNDLDRLFERKADRDTLAQVYKIIRSNQDKLFSRDYQLVSLKTYFQHKLSSIPDFADQFSAYLKERYSSRVAKAIETFDIDKLQDYLRETSGLASFPKAEAMLMQEYFNRGDLSNAKAYADRLLNNANFAKEAAAYLLIIEKELEVANELRQKLPQELLEASVQFKGQTIKLKALADQCRSKETASKGPGSLLVKIPLASDLKSTVDGRTSEFDWDQYFIPRSQRKLVKANQQWFSSSPIGTEVSDSQGKILWNNYSFMPADDRIQNSPRSYKGAVINKHYYNLNYNSSQKTFTLQKRNLKGEIQWDSSYLKSFSKWEPCSIPFSKMDSNIILLVERDRQAAPVFAIAFIDLESGELESVQSLAKIRDPFKQEGHYDIFKSLLQFDNFCEDREAIYLYSGSGLVAKVNAFEKRIEWVRSCPQKMRKYHEGDSFDWTNPARTASPYLTVIDGKLIHFDNASMSWYALDSATGEILWKNSLDLPTYIHSRSESKIVFSHLNSRNQHMLKSLSITSGRVIWQKHLGNLSLQGEGTLNKNVVYLPVKRGIVSFDLKKKELLGRKLLNISPERIAKSNDNFLVYGEGNAFLLRADGQLPSTLDDNAQEINLTLGKADEIDLKYFSNDGLISFSFNSIYFKERPIAHSLDNPAYSIIQYLNDYALIKESTIVNGQYSPSQLVWQKRFPNFMLKEKKILAYSSGSVSVFNTYNLKSEFLYKPISGEVIYAARWNKNHLYILCSDGSLKQFDLKTKKQTKEFFLSARDFIIKEDRLLSFPHAHTAKNKVYQITDKLSEIKILDKRYHMGDQLQSNSYTQGWLTHHALNIFDFRKLKMHEMRMGHTPHRSWRLSERYAATNYGDLLDLSDGKYKKHKFNALGNKGFVHGQGSDYIYASNNGLIKLERFSEFMKVYDDNLTKGKQFKGWCREVDDQLVVVSNKMRNVYDLKTSKLISRMMIDGPSTEATILTDRSLIKVHKGYSYLYNSLNLPSETIAYNPKKIDSLFWQKANPKFWYGKNNYPIPELEYRLSDNSKELQLQVRFKNHAKLLNHFGVSLNSHRFHDAFYAEFTEKGSNVGHLVGDNLKEPFKHHFSADGYEYLEIKIDKPDLMANHFDGFLSFELSLLDQGEKVGSMRFGSVYQPNTSSRENTCGTRSYLAMDKERYAKLDKLYAESKVLLADGESLSQFIKARRNHHSIASNVTYLEELLTRHSKTVQAHNVLSVLFIEYLRSLNLDEFTNSDLQRAFNHCKKLADKLGLKSYDRALSFCVIDFNKNNNAYVLPTHAKLMGRGSVYLDLRGSLQFAAADGRVALPMGFFGEQLKELDRLELESPRRFKAVLGSFELFHKGKLSPVIDSEAGAQAGLKEGNWKNAHEAQFDFYASQRSKSWYPKSDRIRVQKIAFESLDIDYNWDEKSLLLNLTCNPLNRWRASEMLKKYIQLKGADDLVELCSEILANDSANAHLLEAILEEYGEHAGKDLKNYQSLMSKARVPINLRRTMSLENFADQDWQQLGPVNTEKSANLDLLSKPEENLRKSTFKLSNESVLSFVPQQDNGKNFPGFMYLRKEFTSTSSSNAYLHIKVQDRRNTFNNLRIWHNGSVLEDTVLNRDQYQSNMIKIPLRKGKNSILIKYSFEYYTNLKFKLGNVYGGDLSYIKR
ncbi:hypothetical protein LNTAR_15562 [Lentisphaera araneosa HTCC2155]|uniref:Uncharacterized protein n=1 Tax=Lentisphaera araneosa HTCC2155 TaxID=313628 RepID=A6DMB0_9BACT|nr:hypothetical protein [Lentisphaera araneosa]EDM27100.1 hypothetical protein LNTAR_15562 [Lentisphaera araneosa HTCC2155]